METMTPLQIKRGLEDVGYTQTMIAIECGVSGTSVSQIIKNIRSSHRIRCHIANILGKPVEEVFPIKRNPTKRGPESSIYRAIMKY